MKPKKQFKDEGIKRLKKEYLYLKKYSLSSRKQKEDKEKARIVNKLTSDSNLKILL